MGILAVDAKNRCLVKVEGEVEVLKEDRIVENVVIEGGARTVINLREGQRIWWGSGMFAASGA